MISRNVGEKRMKGVVLLHVAKSFDNVWNYGLFKC
jgi:hypothetical protein